MWEEDGLTMMVEIGEELTMEEEEGVAMQGEVGVPAAEEEGLLTKQDYSSWLCSCEISAKSVHRWDRNDANKLF